MSNEQNLAPIALFVYKRAKHTKATLDALAKNNLAVESDLFVFSDGPKGDWDAFAVEQTRKVIRAAKGFKSVTLLERPGNMGLARSVIGGVSELLKKFECVIVLEDDLLTSENFLTYMNDALLQYRDDPKAFSVTGHTFPGDVLNIPGDYPYDTYAGYRCSSWSWGTWTDRWQRIDWGMDYFPALSRDPARQAEFNAGGQDLMPMLTLQHEKKIDSWAIRFSYAHHTNDCRCIYPIKTLVRNIGLDNSGTHSRMDRRFLHSRLDDAWLPSRFVPADSVEARITDNFYAVFKPPFYTPKDVALRKLKRVSELLGCKFRSFVNSHIHPDKTEPVSADILMVNTLEKSGGAARAAYRCFEGIRKLYPNAHYLNLFSDDANQYVHGLSRNSKLGKLAEKLNALDRLPLLHYPNRKALIFSPTFWANPMRTRLADFDAKLVHLHWVAAGMLEVEELLDLDGPVVWTLHDQWAFTGGCHYADDCTRFMQQCGKCPLLGSDKAEDVSHNLWLRKLNAYSKTNLTVVTPTHWMAALARQSSLFANKRVEVIPNGLDTDVFRPYAKYAAKAALGIPQDRPALLFGAHLVSDTRKGGDLLAKALTKVDFPCTLIMFGEGALQFEANPNITFVEMGSMTKDEKLAEMYSAADVFICPSRVDNLPNTVAEALACGTPCVAFDVAGLPDMISHQVNGWLAEPFEAHDLLKGIVWTVSHPHPEQLRAAARAKAENEYSMQVASRRYQALFSELLNVNLA
jgi:glycosyltransferase involved in cell wall biosynthesis